MDTSQTPPILRAISDTNNSNRTLSEFREELEEFYEYAASLRSLWHWIELLTKHPDESSYFHEYLMEEIELGDGFIYCPGTIAFPIPPSFPNANTPSKRAIAIAICQIQWYLVGFGETACVYVERLCISLPYCENFKSKILLAVGKAKRDWDRFYSHQECIFVRAADFQQAWSDVVNVLLELFYIVDTELNVSRAEGKTEAKQTMPDEPKPPEGFSDWMQKKDMGRLLGSTFRTLWNNRENPERPMIKRHPTNNQKACYRLRQDGNLG